MMTMHSVADLFQYLRLEWYNRTVATQPNIQKIVPTSGAHTDKTFNKMTYFPGQIIANLPSTVSPCFIIDGCRCLPGTVQCIRRDLVVRSEERRVGDGWSMWSAVH